MVKIILVANNLSVEPTNYSPITKPSDIVVRLGKGHMVPGDRTDLYFIRSQQEGYTGIDRKTLKIQPPIQRFREGTSIPIRLNSTTFYAINSNSYLPKIERVNGVKFAVISSVPTTQKYNLENPSSGLVVLEYLLDTYKKPVFIHNFSWEGWHGHDWEREKKIFETYLKKGQVKIFKPPQSPVNKVPRASAVPLNLSATVVPLNLSVTGGLPQTRTETVVGRNLRVPTLTINNAGRHQRIIATKAQPRMLVKTPKKNGRILRVIRR